MILDVGCGSNPRGDVNVDLLVPEDQWKHVPNPQEIKNFVKADAHFLPFRSESFEEVVCSHLLEHVNNVSSVIQEMHRCARIRLRIILPFRLFGFIYDLFHPQKFLWEREHHKRSYWMNPFNMDNVTLRFANMRAAFLHRELSFEKGLKIPIPFETETIFPKRSFICFFACTIRKGCQYKYE